MLSALICSSGGNLWRASKFSGMYREVLITLRGLAVATLFAFAIAAALMIK